MIGRAGSVQLSKRLQAIADMVTKGNSVADVGCDHGFLSIYLVQNEISPRALAMDVRKGPLSRAKEHVISYGLTDYIETRLSDGLEKLCAGEADTLVCAGMGGRLMQSILEKNEATARSVREWVLQPQSELCAFRRFLGEKNYRIVREDAVCEDGKYYFILKALQAGHAKEVGENIPKHLADKYGGFLLQERNPVLKAYLENGYENYRRIAEQIKEQADGTQRGKRRLSEVLEELADLERALAFYDDRE